MVYYISCADIRLFYTCDIYFPTVGNIAHDLKTPLQSFYSELEGLSISADPRAISSSISSLKGLCSFMLMTINRSLDFVKSESGVPLVASSSTFDVVQSVEWAVDCVRRVSNSVPLRVCPMASDVSQYIIADKQWLEENLMCLTSNSTKFTTQGFIDIRVSLASTSTASSRPLSAGTISTEENQGDVEAPPVDRRAEGPEMMMFEVEDSGVGLSDQQMGELFKPFKQAQRKGGGTGNDHPWYKYFYFQWSSIVHRKHVMHSIVCCNLICLLLMS